MPRNFDQLSGVTSSVVEYVTILINITISFKSRIEDGSSGGLGGSSKVEKRVYSN